MSIHDKHRQRLKERFLQEGLEGFNEINALELLLFYCIPRIDTNPLAHRLINRFGSISRVLDASPAELMEVEGVGQNTATYLRLVAHTSRYYYVNSAERSKILHTLDQCGEYLIPYFIGKQVETVYLLCLDAKCKVLCCRQVSQGSTTTAAITTRRVVELALEAKASSVVLAHNHPCGIAMPSQADIQLTKGLMKTLRAVDVILLDHMIVAENDYVSMVQSGMITAEDACVTL